MSIIFEDLGAENHSKCILSFKDIKKTFFFLLPLCQKKHYSSNAACLYKLLVRMVTGAAA